MSDDFNGAKVALFVGERLLTILRDDRPDIPFPDMWDFPGGGREGDETPFQTMAREVREEVNLVVSPEVVIWAREYEWPGALHWFFVARLPELVADQIRLGDEGQDWRLVTAEAFLQQSQTITHMQDRLRDWMVGR